MKPKKFSQRLLLAVELPRFVREHLLNSRKSWRKRIDGDFRWIPPLNLHMTLRFVGELEVAQSKALSRSLSSLAQSTEPFRVSIGDVRALPMAREAKIIALGIEESPELLELVGNVNDRCKKIQIPKDRKQFLAHVTLARATEPQNVPPLKVSSDLKGFMVKNFSLIESRMGQNGPTYHQLRQFDLSK